MNLELNFHKIKNYRNLILDCIWRHEFEKVINNLGLFSLKMGEKTTYFSIFIEFNVSWQPLIIIEEEDILLCLDTENHFVKYNNVTEIFHFFHFFHKSKMLLPWRGKNWNFPNRETKTWSMSPTCESFLSSNMYLNLLKIYIDHFIVKILWRSSK